MTTERNTIADTMQDRTAVSISFNGVYAGDCCSVTSHTSLGNECSEYQYKIIAISIVGKAAVLSRKMCNFHEG